MRYNSQKTGLWRKKKNIRFTQQNIKDNSIWYPDPSHIYFILCLFLLPLHIFFQGPPHIFYFWEPPPPPQLFLSLVSIPPPLYLKWNSPNDVSAFIVISQQNIIFVKSRVSMLMLNSGYLLLQHYCPWLH